jgi:hypothetical protein
MHYSHNYLYNTGSDPFTTSHHYELPPTSSICQLSLAGYYEFDDQANFQIGFNHVEYLDSSGVTRHIDYSSVPEYPIAIGVNGLTRIDWQTTVSNCWGDWLLNVFFWDSVS